MVTSCGIPRWVTATSAQGLRPRNRVHCPAQAGYRSAMPSFDIVSQVDMQEVRNAVDQASREIVNRYDFKGTDTSIRLTDEGIVLEPGYRLADGTVVIVAGFQGVDPVAKEITTLDHVSGGRATLGIGAGWDDDEHTAYGIPFPPLGERFERLEEQLEIITGLWSTPLGETYSKPGGHFPVTDSPGLPKPVQDPLPIVVGGGPIE